MLDQIWQQILQGAENSTPLELFAVVFGILSVWYAKKENILVYPTGLINVSIYVYICAIHKLYADMSVNAYYFVVSVYGWVVWSKKDKNAKVLPISTLSRKESLMYTGVAIVSFVILYFTLKQTDTDVPLWDAITTSIFFVAMLLMARKKVEHWIAWIIGDIITIPLYLYKGLAFTSVQYLVFLGIAIAGLRTWRKSLEKP